MKTIIANSLATLILVSVSAWLIWGNPIDFRYQLALSALTIVVVLMCWFFWQPQVDGREPIRWWIWMLVFSIAWTFIGPFIGSLIYRVSYLGLLTFQDKAWGNVGYLGPLAMGPFLFVLAVVSILRGWILKIMERKSSNQGFRFIN